VGLRRSRAMLIEFEKATHLVPFQNYLEFGEDSGTAFKAGPNPRLQSALDKKRGQRHCAPAFFG
jgi:hypothetical protein